MLNRTLIGTATAGLIAAGALAATSSSASASSVYIGGPNFSIGFHTPGIYVPTPRPHKVCQPIFKTVTWWRWGKRHSAVIKVGEKCFWTTGNRGPFPPNPHPFPKPFPKPGPWVGPNPGWGGPHW